MDKYLITSGVNAPAVSACQCSPVARLVFERIKQHLAWKARYAMLFEDFDQTLSIG